MRFQLDVSGDHRLSGIGIRNVSPNISFASISSIQDRVGNEVNWWTNVLRSDYLEAEWALTAGFPASEPVVITIGTSGFAGGVTTTDMTYTGAGCVGLVDCSELFATSGSVTVSADGVAGTVTPEPQTVVLLAIGLALLGGVAFIRSYA